MSKDDYHVIVYQILSYLYQRLKKGENVDPRQISCQSDFFRINRRYWNYIMVNLQRQGFVTGLILVDADNAEPQAVRLDGAQITPLGIEYLTENSTMAKAKRFFAEAKDYIIPFI